MRGAVHTHSRQAGGRSALNITLIYLLFGGFWILFSDQLLNYLVADPALQLRLQTFKGWFYVAVTGLMLYLLIGRSAAGMLRANGELRRSEEDLQTVLNTIPALVFVTDAAGRLLRFNDLFARVTGRPTEQLPGKTCTELFLFEDPETHCRNDEEIVRTGEPKLNMVEKIETVGGSRWFEVSKMPLKGRGGEVQALLGFAVEITERRLVEDALRRSRSLLQSILDNAPNSIFVKDLEGRYQLVNRSFQRRCNLSGQEMLGRTDYDLAPPEEAETYRRHDLEVIESNSAVEREDIVRVGGETHTYIAVKFPLLDSAGVPYAVCGISTDITDRIAGEEALRESESKFRMLAESSASAILYHLDDGSLAYVNPAAERMTGYTREELLKLRIWDLLHPDFHAAVEARLRARQEGENIVSQNEVPLVVKGGETRWITYTAGRVLIQGAPAIIAMATDVTERRQAEEQLHASREQLRALSARLLSAREEERKRIAREIHDELGQALTGLIIELSWLEDKLALLPEPEHARPLLDKTASMLRLADSTVESVRRIAGELRPGLLDDFGLAAAIEWHAQEFEQRTGVICHVSSELDETILSPEQATALFRILQEALTNVARHAAATRVQVRIFQDGGELVLSVEDDGRGIRKENLSSARSLGVIGMRERAALLGGAVQIEGAQGFGTRVVARVPVGTGAGEAEAA